jgi:hypothetical protein
MSIKTIKTIRAILLVGSCILMFIALGLAFDRALDIEFPVNQAQSTAQATKTTK